MLFFRRVNLSNSNSNIIVTVIFKTELIVIVILINFFLNNSNSNYNKILELLCISDFIGNLKFLSIFSVKSSENGNSS